MISRPSLAGILETLNDPLGNENVPGQYHRGFNVSDGKSPGGTRLAHHSS
jgi:hypothetical protein